MRYELSRNLDIPMNLDPIVITFGVLSAVVLALTFLRVGPDLVLAGGLTLLLVAKVIEPIEALLGFANPGLMTVAVLFVVAEGLRQTGAMSFVGQLLGQPGSLRVVQARIMLPSALMSAFLNNTPVVATMMPVISDWAKKYRLSVSHLLLPLSYAAILGGMCTLVGTSTTLVVNGELIKSKGRSLSMFEIAWVGVPAMIVGLIYMLLFAKWLLPERKPAFTQLDDPREYTVEMLVESGSPLVGMSIEEAGLRHLPGMYLMEIDRNGHVLAAVSSNERLVANDRLVFVGIVESIVDLQKISGLKPATEQLFKLHSPRSERCLIEAVVSNRFPFVNMTIRDSRFRSHYNAAVIAVARDGQRVHKKIGDIELHPGDTLLLESHPSFVELQRNSRDFFLVSRVEDSTPPRHERAWIARVILVAMVVVVATGLLTMLKAAMLAAGLMIITRCCMGSEARRSVDLEVLVTLGAGLGIGLALERSGAAESVALGLFGLVGQQPRVALAVIYGITMVLTNLITAKAAAVLLLPIALATAKSLGVDFMPFAIAVMVAAAASFATPIGYQTNLMVYGPGGYRYSDFLRIGGPLSLIIWVLTIALAPLAWPFSGPG
jgi:di/tricarboxylate transporter